jgi:sterol desaturase/sphingolipid hydroxylase (fatty acid hydroxylase superfamily)
MSVHAANGEALPSAVLRSWLWPVFVAASALAYGAAFTTAEPAVLVVLLPAAQIAILFALELWLPADPRGAARHDPGLGHDLAHILLGGGLGGALAELILLGATALATAHLVGAAGVGVWPRAWPFAAQAALAIVLADGLEVLRHIAFHRWPRLWRIHALHHAGDRLHVAKSGRNHLLEMPTRGLFVFAPLALLGAPPETLLAYTAATTVLGPIAHANLDLRIPDFLHRIVLTPQVHRIHHARRVDLALHNYANVLPLWDLLFGTFLDPSGRERPAAGLDEDPNPPGFLAQILAPFGWPCGANLKIRKI